MFFQECPLGYLRPPSTQTAAFCDYKEPINATESSDTFALIAKSLIVTAGVLATKSFSVRLKTVLKMGCGILSLFCGFLNILSHVLIQDAQNMSSHELCIRELKRTVIVAGPYML